MRNDGSAVGSFWGSAGRDGKREHEAQGQDPESGRDDGGRAQEGGHAALVFGFSRLDTA